MTKTVQQTTQVQEYIRRFASDFRVCLVCAVEKCDQATMTVEVKPAVKELVYGETNREVLFEEMQPIPNVPLADIAGVRFLPEPGCHGLLLFHDVDLQKYKETRQIEDLETSRNHDYNDCIFLPFETAKVDRPEPYIIIVNEQVHITAPGGIYLNGLSWDTHLHQVGPVPSSTPISDPAPPPIKGAG